MKKSKFFHCQRVTKLDHEFFKNHMTKIKLENNNFDKILIKNILENT